MSNTESLPKLLRAMADSSMAQANGHNIIFNAAADLIEKQDTAKKQFMATLAAVQIQLDSIENKLKLTTQLVESVVLHHTMEPKS